MASLRKRGSFFYIQYYVGRSQRRISTGTDSYQIAQEKLRQFESAQFRGDGSPLPTRTPIAQIVGQYVTHIRTIKTPKSAQTDVYYLRDAFGPICDELKVTSRKLSSKAKKRPPKEGQDRRRRALVIEAPYFEYITTAHVSAFISGQVQSRGLAPKTANRYREILHRLFSWAIAERSVRTPGDKNPVTKVGRYKEKAPEIRFLTMAQINEQLDALAGSVQLQTMVAMLIYAGLRREEVLWLRPLVAGPRRRRQLRKDRSNLPQASYRQLIKVRYRGVETSEEWHITSGLYVDEGQEVLDAAQSMLEQEGKALPWAGAAVRVDSSSGQLQVLPADGRLFCFLPLPKASNLPVHINGFENRCDIPSTT